MAYTTPTTRASGAVITESIWNTDLVDNISYLKSERDIAVQASPVGHMLIWLTDTAPTKFLLCYGQAISRTTYSALYAVIGTAYGAGDGATTFNLPDMRGRFPLGQDDMGGSSANVVTAAAADTLGSKAGAELYTLSAAELPEHNHKIQAAAGTSGGANTGVSVLTDRTSASVATTGYVQGNSVAGGTAFNNMPPYITLNFIIYTGV